MAIGLKVLALMINQPVAREVKEALRRVEGLYLDLHMVSEDRPLNHIGKDSLPDVVLLEINGHKGEDIQDVQEVVAQFGDRVTIFVTYGQGDTETLRKLMRAGVRDVFPQPISPEELVTEFTQVLSQKRSRLREEQTPKGSVVAFLNAKGGSGSTTLATNLGYQLATDHDAKVAVLDLDIQFGNVALSLNLQPERTIVEALRAPERVDPVFLEALMTEHRSGLQVLASPASIKEVETVPSECATAVIQAAVETYDYVILDVPRIFTNFTLAALAMAEPVYLVLQTNLATLQDARTIFNALPLKGVGRDRFELLMNRSGGPRSVINIKESDILEILGMEVRVRIRNDFETANKAQDQGFPVAEVNSRSPLAKDLKTLADTLVQTRETSQSGDSSEAQESHWWNPFK